MAQRGIQVKGKCKRCGEPETLLHVMFSCTTACKVWDLVPAVNKPLSSSCHTVEDLLLDCTRMVNLPPPGLTTPLYPWILWVLWTSRNQLLFEDKSFLESEMLAKAIKSAKEWQFSLPNRKHVSVSTKDSRSRTLSLMFQLIHTCYVPMLLGMDLPLQED